MFSYDLEHICSYCATLDPEFEIIGPTPEGLRINVYVTGGDVEGPKLNGKLRAKGADWLTIRPDDVGILDVRATIETHDAALIYLHYRGIGELGEDGYRRFLDGDPPVRFPLRCAPVFVTSHADYAWLNRLQCMSVGEGDLTKPAAAYDVYAIK